MTSPFGALNERAVSRRAGIAAGSAVAVSGDPVAGLFANLPVLPRLTRPKEIRIAVVRAKCPCRHPDSLSNSFLRIKPLTFFDEDGVYLSRSIRSLTPESETNECRSVRPHLRRRTLRRQHRTPSHCPCRAYKPVCAWRWALRHPLLPRTALSINRWGFARRITARDAQGSGTTRRKKQAWRQADSGADGRPRLTAHRR